MANEFITLIDKVNNVIRSEQNQRVALTTTLAIHKQRIFVNGQDANGSRIGTYGTNPISISKKNQARQTGKTYFKAGYAEYKKDIGKNPGFVNLDNFGQMRADYGLVLGSSGFGFGFQNDINAEKAGWMTDKYDKEIFQLSDSELDTYANVLVAQLNQAL